MAASSLCLAKSHHATNPRSTTWSSTTGQERGDKTLLLTLEDNVITYYTDVDEQGLPCGDTGAYLWGLGVGFNVFSGGGGIRTARTRIFSRALLCPLHPALGTIALPHLRAVIINGNDMRIMTASQTMELTVSSTDEAQVRHRLVVLPSAASIDSTRCCSQPRAETAIEGVALNQDRRQQQRLLGCTCTHCLRSPLGMG